jgi:hypothetical protein
MAHIEIDSLDNNTLCLIISSTNGAGHKPWVFGPKSSRHSNTFGKKTTNHTAVHRRIHVGHIAQASRSRDSIVYSMLVRAPSHEK